MNVPKEYLSNMKTLLGDEFDSYAASFSATPYYGLRVNTSKISTSEFEAICPFELDKIPYVSNGYFYNPDINLPSRNPFYYGGLYYLQEPSAMLPADRLPISEGDYVLDLCAAPGGKSTALLNKLNGSGILVSNDISFSRCQALLKNLELFGGKNYFVCAEEPGKLSNLLGPAFDKILVDAPCSGEGMFRRDPSLIKDWVDKGPAYYAPIQQEILEAAYHLLKPGGYLLFSTCTFSRKEDEDNVEALLASHKDLSLVSVEKSDGMRDAMPPCEAAARVFPHLVKGEGHFIALFHKEYSDEVPIRLVKMKSDTKNIRSNELNSFMNRLGIPVEDERMIIKNKQVFLLPDGYERIYREGIRYLRTGLLLGELDEKGHFKPDQALALSLRVEEYPYALNLPLDDERVIRYLKGETITYADEEYQSDMGDVLVCVDSYPLGFAKDTGKNMLKNRIRPGFRMNY